MQAVYGDNTDPKPKALMIEKRFLWTAWEEKKGMS
jgi:acyl-CoA-binding protein